MALPYNIRVNVNVPFPARVQGSGAVTVKKSNGIWTIALDYSEFPQNVSILDPANTYLLTWNSVTGVFALVPASSINQVKSIKTLTAPGPYTAAPNDEILIVKQTSGAPFTVLVDWSARTKALRVVDGKGDASVNNITITPNAGQSQLAQLNFSYVIDGNGGSITLTPLPDATGAY